MRKPKSEVEATIFDVWREWKPSQAYIEGVGECAGRLFVPSEKNTSRLLRSIGALKKEAENMVQQKYLQCMETALEFEEPYMTVSDALWAFFAHLVKESVNPGNMASLMDYTAQALKAAKQRLAERDWSTEIRIVTCNQCNGLIGILQTIRQEARDAKLSAAVNALAAKVKDYRDAFHVAGVSEGDFAEVYPILEKEGGDIGRVGVYPDILRDMYDYPESAGEIEEKGLRWLREELPRLKRVTGELAEIYDVEPSVEKVSAAMSAKRCVDKTSVVRFILDTRSALQRVVEKHVVRITPKYDTRVMETPPYLVNFISTAAMNSFDVLTDKPFNVFFVTTDPKRSPPSAAADLLQTLVHEEYGHCVNYSNSAVGFAAAPSLVELLSTHLHYPVSDGISFHREYEFLTLLKKLQAAEGGELGKPERDFLRLLQRTGSLDQIVLENEFVLMTWRIIRFLRAVGDVRINMHKQNIVKFVEWANRETGLSRKMVFNQIFVFQDQPGYAPCYSMAGDALRRIQESMQKKGRNIVEFNTYAASLGFPPRTIFEQKLKQW